MLKNTLFIALRNMRQYKLFSLTNILGLAVGMAITLLILLFVHHELRYDRHHQHADRIYRVLQNTGHVYRPATTHHLLAPMLQEALPNGAKITRLHRPMSGMSGSRNIVVSSGDKMFYEDGVLFAESSVFDVFDLPVLQGNADGALDDPKVILLTQKMAEKYFGDADPIGQVLTLKIDLNDVQDLTVAGVLKDVPDRSHFKFDFLAPLVNRIETIKARGSRWFPIESQINRLWVYTYVLLPPNHTVSFLEQKLAGIQEPLWEQLQYLKKDDSIFELLAQPLTDIHFYSHRDHELEVGGNITQIYLLLAIAALILFVACINFMNLSTARFAHRAKEVGLRKVVGANRVQLMKQFLGEALFLTGIALCLALVIVELSLPFFQSFVGTTFYLGWNEVGIVGGGLVVFWWLVGIMSGGFPAYVLASYDPVETLTGALKSGPKGAFFRRILVVFQFVVSIGLVTATVVVYQQQVFMQNKALGFNKDQLIVFPVQGMLSGRSRGPKSISKLEALKAEVLGHSGVMDVTTTSSLPNKDHVTFWYQRPEAPESQKLWTALFIGSDFMKTYQVELLEGRNFADDLMRDEWDTVLLNETGARQLGISIGDKMPSDFALRGRDATVIGVVKDFHFSSLHHQVKPMVISFMPSAGQYVSLRIQTQNIPELVGYVEGVWAKFAPGYPLDYKFLDDDFDQLYRAEMKLMQVFGFFSFWAVLIACLGLFALAFFEIDRRSKEIGIRKVLGASVSHIVYVLSKEFAVLLALANVIAWPVIYFAMTYWLQQFAYRITLHIDVFWLGGFMACLIAALMVVYQANQTRRTNPVDILRTE